MVTFPLHIWELVLAQSGVVTAAQLRAGGVALADVRRARRAGLLRPLHGGTGVYATFPEGLAPPDAALRAAVLACGPDVVLSHQTAAARWQLVAHGPPGLIELASRRELTPPEGIWIHRSRLRAAEVVPLDGFAITTVERTLLDIAIRFAPAALDRALREAEFHHGTRPEDLAAVLRRGHRGSARLRAAIERHVPGWGEMRSRLERRFRSLLVRHGIPLPRRNVTLGPWIVDCLWPELGVVVELDGRQHARPGQAAVDARRDLWLRANGYVVLRYTWQQVTEDSDAVVADLLAALGARRSG
ncbi:DUF559 domain-containing protein [Paraconexibacter algicola]|uniref:DUF559 domain-containing protein n=1 Tax=Paraconexibacter algicola TaxID=2133960 RepID=A0A2T4UKN2_9ACTN|nr:DUF559 domain-containing protein [Paraconexibacter algicola]PTL59814.1 hypothetical protein C7Y72_09200 [Paraconexibacter algicola]